MIKERADEGNLGWGKTGSEVFFCVLFSVFGLIGEKKICGFGRGG